MHESDVDVRAIIEREATALLRELADQVRAQAALAGSRGDDATALLLLAIADRVEAMV